MAYKFDWKNFGLDRFGQTLRKMPERRFADWCVGSVRVGDICFDLVLRDYGDDGLTLTYDTYVGGIDDGYGYGIAHYPYTFADGGSLSVLPSYGDFKSSAEKVFTEYINDYGMFDLPAKADMPLHIW